MLPVFVHQKGHQSCLYLFSVRWRTIQMLPHERMLYVQFSEVSMANGLGIGGPRDRVKSKKRRGFDAQVFLQSVGASRKVAESSSRWSMRAARKRLFLALGTFLEKAGWRARSFAWGRRPLSLRPQYLSSEKTK